MKLALFFLLASLPLSFLQVTSTKKSTTTRRNDCLELSPYCSCLGGPLYIYCNNFTSFSQLDFTLLGEIRNISIITLYPKQAVILNNSLNLEGIRLIDNIVLNNIAGIDLKQNPFEKWTAKDNLSISFFGSNFSQVMECDSSLINDKFKPIFSSFKTVLFGYGNFYSVQICPLLFYNASLSYLNISDLSYTIQPWFTDVSGIDTIHSNIDTLLILSGHGSRITKGLMNGLVFENLNTILISNTVLQKIDDDAFYNIHNLRSLNFRIVNFEKFFKNSTNKWMQSLNSKIKVDYSDPASLSENQNNSILVNLNPLSSSFFFYFTDDDYDNFQYFPHDNFVFARIVMLYPLECSTTMNFLLKNARYYPLELSDVNTTATYKCFPELQTSTKYPTTTDNQGTTITNNSINYVKKSNIFYTFILIHLGLFMIL
ncbi:hypothetical protein BpHYR1_016099 [Brachionus plicatilis]|uniref:Uncharacterized protein n=1 Tax=Brachionus plicatilis TaxID=10195 RepID=A0A3M7QRL8_BRAPC|nr:hypothetical protein BpHYR1_016099 [Brachionus plicatilis]